MIFNNDIKCHINEGHFPGFEKDEWKIVDNYRVCSYCGSIHPEDFYNYLLKLDESVKNAVEPADQKYGYLHKIYFDGYRKFYTKHLLDIEDKETLNILLLTLKEKGRINLKIGGK